MRPRNINLDDGQYETLQGLANLSPIGRPAVASLVRQAIDEFIARAFAADPTLRDRLDRSGRPKLVSLQPRKFKPENGER